MKKEYKHVRMISKSTKQMIAEELRHKTFVFWLGDFNIKQLNSILYSLALLKTAEERNGISLAVKFVAIDFQNMSVFDKVQTAITLENYDAGILDTSGKTMNEFAQWYDNRIEEKIVKLQKSDDEELAKELRKKAEQRLLNNK